MYRILPLLCDIGLGLLSTLFVEWVLSTVFTPLQFAVGVAFALLLDIDALVDKELWRSGYAASHAGNPHDHRELLHKPILWILGALLLCFASLEWGLLILCSILVHFLHDSAGTGFGIAWLWPFSRRNYKFFATKENLLTLKQFMVSWGHDEMPQVMTDHGVKEWIPQLYLLPTPVSIIEYSIFGLSVVLMLWRGIL